MTLFRLPRFQQGDDVGVSERSSIDANLVDHAVEVAAGDLAVLADRHLLPRGIELRGRLRRHVQPPIDVHHFIFACVDGHHVVPRLVVDPLPPHQIVPLSPVGGKLQEIVRPAPLESPGLIPLGE